MKEIKLKWQGKEASIPEAGVFLAADAVEEHVTVGELLQMRAQRGKIRFARLAIAYAALLQSAGIAAAPSEIHKEFTKALKSGAPADRLSFAVQAIDDLCIILMDGVEDLDDPEEDEPSGNDQPPVS